MGVFIQVKPKYFNSNFLNKVTDQGSALVLRASNFIEKNRGEEIL